MYFDSVLNRGLAQSLRLSDSFLFTYLYLVDSNYDLLVLVCQEFFLIALSLFLSLVCRVVSSKLYLQFNLRFVLILRVSSGQRTSGSIILRTLALGLVNLIALACSARSGY